MTGERLRETSGRESLENVFPFNGTPISALTVPEVSKLGSLLGGDTVGVTKAGVVVGGVDRGCQGEQRAVGSVRLARFERTS